MVTHGMISQVEGLATSLKTEFVHKFIKINFIEFLPPKFLPISSYTFNFKEIISNINPESLPDYFIISCGRKSVIANIYLKKLFKRFNTKKKNYKYPDTGS